MLTQEVVSAYISNQLSNHTASLLDTLSNVRMKILQEHDKLSHEYEIVHTCTHVNNNYEEKQHSNNDNNAISENTIVDLFPRQCYNGRHGTHTGRLCRVRGMIQEIQSEMHLYAASRSNFFNAPCYENDEELLDAMVLYVVPVPGNLHFYETEKATLANASSNNKTEQTSKLSPEVYVERDTNAAKCNMDCTSTSTLPLSELSTMLPIFSNLNNVNSNSVSNTNTTTQATRKRWQSEVENEKFAHWNENDNVTERTFNNSSGKEEKELLPEEQQQLLEEEEERELHSSSHNAERVEDKPFSLDTYLNFSHPALCRNLQSACIVTVVAPKMHLTQKSFVSHNNNGKKKKKISKDGGVHTNINDSNQHEYEEECEKSQYQGNKVKEINNNEDRLLRINDIVDFYGFVQEPEECEEHEEECEPLQLQQLELHEWKEYSKCVADEERIDKTHEGPSMYNNKGPQRSREMEFTIAEFDRWRGEELPFGLVPRLVCLAYVHVNTTPLSLLSSPSSLAVEQEKHELELPSHDTSTPRLLTSPALSNMHCSCVAEMQPRVVEYLAHYICKGDVLLSEYLLLHLCGRTVAHTAVTPVGDVPLWVYSPKMNAHRWSSALRAIAPIAELLIDKSLLLAAEMRLHPQHDTTQNYLRTGLLQVGNGTHLTFNCDDLMSLFDHDHVDSTKECDERERANEHSEDETTTRGAFSGRGSSWKDALFALVHKQLLLLDYPYQTLELPVDVSILALSTTSRTSTTKTSNVKKHQQYHQQEQEEEEQESLLRSQADEQSKINHNMNTNYEQKETDTPIPALFDFALKLPWKPVAMSSAHLNKKYIDENNNSNSNTHQVDAGNVLLTSNEVRAYLLTVRRINPCFEYDQDNEECSNDSDFTNSTSGGNKRISLHVLIAEAFTKMSTEIPHWLNRDALVHNNTFSAVTALLRARAVSCGRSRVTAEDLEFVLSLERQRMERLQQT